MLYTCVQLLQQRMQHRASHNMKHVVGEGAVYSMRGDAVLKAVTDAIATASAPDFSSDGQSQAQAMCDLLQVHWISASARYTDNVFMILENHLVRELPKQLQGSVGGVLSDSGKAVQLMCESTSVAMERKRLQDSAERLTKARALINEAMCASSLTVTTATVA